MYVLFVFGINVVVNITHIQILGMIIGLGLLLPNLAIGARRLHDTGRSGWLQLLWLIPIIGWIIVIIWLAEEGKSADNQYGKPATPKVVAGMVSTPTATPTVDTPSTPTSPVVTATPTTLDHLS